MKKIIAGLAFAFAVCMVVPIVSAGFDDFGYNYQAGIFVGTADGVDRVLDGKVWGDPTYANDHLVMKWSKAWDMARFEGAPWTPEAWEMNEWNGAVEGGSGEVWHYKIIWVGSPKWDVTGDWIISVNNGAYLHDYTFTMTSLPDGTFVGVGNYPSEGTVVFDEIVTNGVITDNTIVFTATYYNPTTHLPTGYSWTATGTIASDGSMSGIGTSGVVNWASISGQATLDYGEYWREGGYLIWGQFEVIMDQGSYEGIHVWLTKSTPCGYGC